ncbi:MAG: hypothetical protein R3A11_00260 [Bdellovibrionota bacterium]
MDQKKTLTIRVGLGFTPDKLRLPPNCMVSQIPQGHVISFGIPVRHENDVETAIEWALHNIGPNDTATIQEEIINLETFLPAKKDTLPEPQQDSHGIFVSKPLSKIYSRIFEFEEHPEGPFVGLKGKKQSPSRLRGMQELHAPLIGRQYELNYFIETLEQSREDEGQVLSIVGDAGMGKSRLKEECLAYLKKKKHPFAEANYACASHPNLSRLPKIGPSAGQRFLNLFPVESQSHRERLHSVFDRSQ